MHTITANADAIRESVSAGPLLIGEWATAGRLAMRNKGLLFGVVLPLVCSENVIMHTLLCLHVACYTTLTMVNMVLTYVDKYFRQPRRKCLDSSLWHLYWLLSPKIWFSDPLSLLLYRRLVFYKCPRSLIFWMGWFL